MGSGVFVHQKVHNHLQRDFLMSSTIIFVQFHVYLGVQNWQNSNSELPSFYDLVTCGAVHTGKSGYVPYFPPGLKALAYPGNLLRFEFGKTVIKMASIRPAFSHYAFSH